MELSIAFTIVLAVTALFIVTLVVKGIRIVPEQSVMMIERLGKFSRQLNPGLNIIIPVIDAPREVLWRSTHKDEIGQKRHVVHSVTNLDLREQVYDFPAQQVITSDNVGIRVDAVVYFQVVDAKKSTYEIANLPIALETLTQTTLRNVIGDMELDETLSSRDIINSSLVATIDEAAQGWGVKVNRVEVQDIEPPTDVTASMEQVMKAERERRARITEAEGIKAAVVLKAEGERDARIAEAEGERQAQIAEAKGRAEAIREIAEAKKKELELLAERLGSDLPSYLIALRYMESVDRMAENQNVVWMPHSAGDLGSYLGGFKQLLASNA
jgi:regulator of protease activity HflC (stomatin/prohibitin superfamily)